MTKKPVTKELTHYDAVIADLEAKRDQLATMITALKQLKASSGALVSVIGEHSPPVVSTSEIPHDAFFGMTIPEAAKKYLNTVRRTKPHPELCDALLEGGFVTASPNFREVVRSTLGRQPDFVKISGQWGLREWYGSRGKRQSKRATGGDALGAGPESSAELGEIEKES